MTSESDDRVFVWVWLPGATEPVVAGALDRDGARVDFSYGMRYLGRADAIPLYRDLPLEAGRQVPEPPHRIAASIIDSSPDAWGRRVIERRLRSQGRDVKDDVTYLIESGSDRTGALDFQHRATDYVPRSTLASVAEADAAARAVEEGASLTPEMAEALMGASSIGGARPKAAVTLADGRRAIAKFSSTTDQYPIVRSEAVTMELAHRVGLDVARTELGRVNGRDVLFVDRFDRRADGGRRLVVSALTILGLTELHARDATYAALADEVRAGFTEPDTTLRELFSRIGFNICVGNTDDHARNTAAFWDGDLLTLTPAYDLVAFDRGGGEASQVMAYGEGEARSRLGALVNHAGIYHLDADDARGIVDAQVETIRDQWTDAADAAHLTTDDRARLWGRAVLNPSIFY